MLWYSGKDISVCFFQVDACFWDSPKMVYMPWGGGVGGGGEEKQPWVCFPPKRKCPLTQTISKQAYINLKNCEILF